MFHVEHPAIYVRLLVDFMADSRWGWQVLSVEWHMSGIKKVVFPVAYGL